MNQAYRRAVRKIDPNRGVMLPDGTLNDNDRIEIGPTPLAYAEWAAAGLQLPNLAHLRQFRLDRLVAELHARDIGGVLVFDPLNIRYATDTTNMQLWNSHNPFRACLVCADGHMILWEYKSAPFLADHNPLVREVRSGASMFYFTTGDHGQQAADGFAAQVAEVMGAHAGTNRRLAVDKIMLRGARALEAQGFELMDGEEVTEHARKIKGPDEILAMRCAVHACEVSLAAMEAAIAPGKTEDEIWAVLHAENIKRGGEWARDASVRNRAPHQPLVPGMRAPGGAGKRDRGPRYRSGGLLRALRGYQPHLVDRPRPAAPQYGGRDAARP